MTRPSLMARVRPTCRPLPSRILQRRAISAVRAAADAPIATDVNPASASRQAVRKYLNSAGFQEAWVDGIVAEITKGTLTTSPEQCDAVISYLQGLDIPLHRVENMASICKGVLGRPVDRAQAVVAWLQARGVTGEQLRSLLLHHPEVLTYDPSPGGEHLSKGQARASLSFAERGGRRFVGLALWREGCVFGSAPVAPAKPGP